MKIPVFCEDRLVERADPCRALALSTGRNVIVRRRRGRITAIVIGAIALTRDDALPYHGSDSCVTTEEEELFQHSDDVRLAGQRKLVQHKRGWLTHWPEISRKETAELFARK